MHNLIKIKIFRALLLITYPIAIVFIYPLVLLKKRSDASLFFFFDRYSIGGAQRVHLDILQSVSDIQKKIYFTRKSVDGSLKHSFFTTAHAETSDIHFWCDNLLFRLFSVHYFSFLINRNRKAIVLGANSTFFYDMLPFLSRQVFTIELLHNFTHGKRGMEFFGLANHHFLNKRMVIDGATRENIREQYRQFEIAPVFFDRVELVEFGVVVPAVLSKDLSKPLKVLYAGRGGPQKRVWLVNRIAEYLFENQAPVEFHFAGTMQQDLSETMKGKSIFHGEITNKEDLDKIYADCQVLILTSAYEGFPMVIKEAMAYGCVPVVTALEGIMTHLTHLSNALLINDAADEDKVVAGAIQNILCLIADPSLLASLSANAYDYARTHFSKNSFLSRYRAILSHE